MNKKILAIIPVLLMATVALADGCPEGYSAQFVETLDVPCDSTTSTTTSSLTEGVQYIFDASGTCFWRVEGSAGGYIADSSYWLRHDSIYEGWRDQYSLAMWDNGFVNIPWIGTYEGPNAHEYEYDYVTLTSGPVQFIFTDDQYGDNSGSLNVDIYECVRNIPDRTAEITSPEIEESVSECSVDFDAYLIDDDYDAVQWAIRKGTCAAGTNTVFGNVDGFNNPFDWIFDGEYTYNFHAQTDVSGWETGNYCFVFNPKEDLGESDIRLTREFSISDLDEDGINDCSDMCLDSQKDLMELGTNRWMVEDWTWVTGEIKGKGKGPQLSYDYKGCTCSDILTWLNENYPEEYGNMEGHWKFGCSISVMNDFISLTSQ
ncbi:MAG: hypothetical protein JW700_03265 [Candidatus Aenigmarchaeota archaeon]|nr:hypothetical protein [Candidatus Aenigmarchaeota archaeon]